MRPTRRAPRGLRAPISSPHTPRPACQTGVALIAVLWLIVLLTMLASGAATLSVTHRRVAARYGEAVRRQALEDSAIRVVLLRLLAAQEPERARLLSGPQRVGILRSTVAVTVTREAGRVDLNTSDPQMLLALFSANGFERQQAELIGQQIASWRGSGRGGSASPLPQTPFESSGELRQVLGGEALRSEIEDALTVYSHLTVPVAAAAPAAVRRALSWADQQELGGHRWLNRELAGEPHPGSADLSSPLVGEVLRVRSCLSDQPAGCRLAVVRLTGNARRPFEAFTWQTAHDF